MVLISVLVNNRFRWFFTYNYRERNARDDLIFTPGMFWKEEDFLKIAIKFNHYDGKNGILELPHEKPPKEPKNSQKSPKFDFDEILGLNTSKTEVNNLII